MKREIFLYNSLSKKKDLFVPLDNHHVRIYVCGPTIYDSVHLGNARPLVVFDILTRLLKTQFDQVTYVRNITDVDDKILDRARELEVSIYDLTNRTFQDFQKDVCELGVLKPDVEPKATEHIEQMIHMIQKLIDEKAAYENEGHVLFSVDAFPDYGALSKRSLEDMRAGARVEVAPYKKTPFDFVLWKPSSGDQPGWESPFGWGRPGWHIECSAMSHHYLGSIFDIHGGGSDLLFPHHENERAQTCAAFHSSEMARYWVHNGMLLIDGQKMSKSLGNFITLREALNQYSGDWVRIALISTHYRSALDWTNSLLEQSRMILDKFIN
jgi:cysteinyl-tRNA synthetase